MDALVSLLLWPWRLFSSLVSNCLRLCVSVVLFPVRCVASLAKLCLDIIIAVFSWAESKIALLKARKPFVYLFPSLPGNSKDLVLPVPITPTSVESETRQLHRRKRKKKAQLSGSEEASAEDRAREAERNLSLILELIRLSKDKASGETDSPQPPLTADESIYWLSQQLRQKSEDSGHAAPTSKEEEAKLVGIVKDLQQYAAHERARSPSHVHTEEGSDVSSMLHDLGQLESYLSRFVEDAEEDSTCTPHARATSLETIPEEYNSKESSPRLPRSRHLSSTSATDQDDGMGEVMEEFTRTFEDLKSSKQGSKWTISTSKDGAKCQSLGEVNQPPVSSSTRRSDSHQKKQKAPQKQGGKEETSQRQMRERVAQQGLLLRRDSSSSQRSSLDSPDFDSSPVMPAQENKQTERILRNTQEELQSVFESLVQKPVTSLDKPSPAKGTAASPAIDPYEEQIYDTLPCPPNPPKPSSALTAEQKRALREFAGVQEDIYDTLPSQLASNPKASSTASPSATPPQLPPLLRRTNSDGGASTGSEGSPYTKRKRDFRRHSAEDGEYERRRHRHRRHSHRHNHGSSECCHYRDFSPDRCDCCHRSRPREQRSCCHGCRGCSGIDEFHENCDHQTRGLVRDSSGYESQEEERRKRTDSVGSGGRATPTNPSTPKEARKGLFGLFNKKSNSLTSLSSRGGDQSDQFSVSSYKL